MSSRKIRYPLDWQSIAQRVRQHIGQSNTTDVRQTISQVLLTSTDAGLALAIFVAPLFMGGRHPVGRLVLAVCVLFALLSWLGRQCCLSCPTWRRCGVEWFALGGLVILVLPIIPLRQDWLQLLSPGLAESLPLWFSGVQDEVSVGNWPYLSLTPYESQLGLAMYLVYLSLYWVTVQRLEEIGNVQQVLRWIAVGTAGMAMFGLLQYLTSNGKFFWLYSQPYRDTFSVVKGSFANENHFAHFLALGFGPLAWWLQDSIHRKDPTKRLRRKSPGRSQDDFQWHTFLIALSLGLVTFAGLLTFSRGGILVILIAAAICFSIYALHTVLDRSSVCVSLGIGVVVIAAVLIHGHVPLRSQLQTLRVSSLSEVIETSGRGQIWAADLRAVSTFPMLGTGVGSHRDVYRRYFPHYSPVEYTHAESGLLHTLLETGLAGFALLSCVIAVFAYWCVRGICTRRSPSHMACVGAVVSGLGASLLHSVVDFTWFVPACMSLTAILAACLCRLHQLGVAEQANRYECVGGSTGYWCFGFSAALIAAVSIVILLGRPALAARHWERYLVLSSESEATSPLLLTNETSSEDPEPIAMMLQSTQHMRFHLERVLAWSPHNADAHLRVASLYLREFELLQKNSVNAMSLALIRDAALASQFSSCRAQDEWLGRAIGENRSLLQRALCHTYHSLALSPWHGKGYIFLAELSFLRSNSARVKEAMVKQALNVRPYDGTVLLAAGHEALLTGDMVLALAHWKRAFQQGPKHADSVVELFARHAPANVVVAALEPDLAGLKRLYAHYRESGSPHDLRHAAEKYLAQIEAALDTATDEEAGRLWFESHQVHRTLLQEDNALDSLQKAVEVNPQEISWRKTLGYLFLHRNRFSEAVEHLQWCSYRRPNDKLLNQRLRLAHRGMVTQ